MFYCQPVLGIGHLVRSLEIVRGLGDFHVFFINGGAALSESDLPSGVELINLPPMKTDPEFRGINSSDDVTDTELTKALRAKILLESFERIQPDILLIELFPFGRLKFDFELIPLLESTGHSPEKVRIVCSLRDILVKKSDQKRYEDFVIKTVNKYFDLILVHSDPSFQRIEETFPKAHELICPVVYTGYVVQPLPVGDPGAGTGSEKTIVASIGGGRVGLELLECAAEASLLIKSELPHRLLIFAGPHMPEADFIRLKSRFSDCDHIRIERYTANFASLLKSADLSISMAGYNTSMNIITSGVNAIVHPFTGNNNDEQTIRAVKLKEAGVVEIIERENLKPRILADMIEQVIKLPKKQDNVFTLDMDGVEKTVRYLGHIERGDLTPLSIGIANSRLFTGSPGQKLRQAAALHNRALNIFFRNDDVADNDPGLRRLVDIFTEAGVPLNLQIIPGLLTENCSSFLLELKTAGPGLIELNQHGWLHKNHEPSGRKCEFGSSRNFEQQLADIRAGKERLEEMLGDAFNPVFTPPWNRYTDDTVRVLEALEFKALSALQRNGQINSGTLREISVTLDIIDWKNGAVLKPMDHLMDDLARQIAVGDTIGILIHHQVMGDEAFGFVSDLLRELRQFENPRFHTFESILSIENGR